MLYVLYIDVKTRVDQRYVLEESGWCVVYSYPFALHLMSLFNI